MTGEHIIEIWTAMRPSEWNEVLAPGVPDKHAYMVIANVARQHLRHNVLVAGGVTTYELVEALYPIALARQTRAGIDARLRLLRAFDQRKPISTSLLADCMTPGPEQWLPWKGRAGQPSIWHAPTKMTLAAEIHRDVFLNTMDAETLPQNRLRAVKIYVEGVKQDFPETTTWMNNILELAGFNPNE